MNNFAIKIIIDDVYYLKYYMSFYLFIYLFLDKILKIGSFN